MGPRCLTALRQPRHGSGEEDGHAMAMLLKIGVHGDALPAGRVRCWVLLQRVAGEPPEKDRLAGPAGELEITFLGHGSLIFASGGTVVHVDPYGKLADYARAPEGRPRPDHPRAPGPPRPGRARRGPQGDDAGPRQHRRAQRQVEGATRPGERRASDRRRASRSRRSRPTTSSTSAARRAVPPEGRRQRLRRHLRPACGSTSPATRRTSRR